MNEHYENGPEGMPRVERMTDSTIGWLMNELPLLNCLHNERSYEEMRRFAHVVAEEVLARVPSWPKAERTTSPVSALTDDLAGKFWPIIAAATTIPEHEVSTLARKLADLAAAAPAPAIQQESIDTPNFWKCVDSYVFASRTGALLSVAKNDLRAHIDAHTAAAVAKAREEGRQAGLRHACQTIENSNNTAQEALRQRDDLAAQLVRDKADWCNIPLQDDHPQELAAFKKWHIRVAPGFRQYSIYNDVELRAAWAAWMARAERAEAALAQPVDLSKLTRYDYEWGKMEIVHDGEYVCFADVEQLLAAAPAAPYPTRECAAEALTPSVGAPAAPVADPVPSYAAQLLTGLNDPFSRQPQPVAEQGELPPLPEPFGRLERRLGVFQKNIEIHDVYTAGQMRDYARAAIAASQQATEPDVKGMVDRFLGWKLPQDFAPDCGISFKPSDHPHSWPIGTNLLTANQAKAMFEHCAIPATKQQDSCKPNADCSGDPMSCPDNEGYGCACDPMNKAASAKKGGA